MVDGLDRIQPALAAIAAHIDHQSSLRPFVLSGASLCHFHVATSGVNSQIREKVKGRGLRDHGEG